MHRRERVATVDFSENEFRDTWELHSLSSCNGTSPTSRSCRKARGLNSKGFWIVLSGNLSDLNSN